MPHDHHDHPHHLLPEEGALKLQALEQILLEKGLVRSEAIEAILQHYQHQIGPHIGAELVARAWCDADFKRRLIEDTHHLLDELGYLGRQGEHIVVVENTPDCHHMVVCTLCSCYPWPLLGIPPAWYKSDAYRSRAVSEPRAVLAEFGVDIPADKSVRVWDSTAEIRYLVLPEKPAEIAGLSWEEAAKWVTRDSMIGTALPAPPQPDTPHPEEGSAK